MDKIMSIDSQEYINPLISHFNINSQEKNPYLYPLAGPPGMKKIYDNERYIDIIFEEHNAVNKHLFAPQIIIKCSIKDKISTLIEKYKEKVPGNITKKMFAFGNNPLNFDMTVEQSKLYMNCVVKVINVEEEYHWGYV